MFVPSQPYEDIHCSDDPDVLTFTLRSTGVFTQKFRKDDILLIDSDNRDVTDQYKSQIPETVKRKLLENENANAIDITVRPGEVYYYKARNGKEFAVVIADIRQGTFEPYLKRVTIKFSEIRGQKKTECPD